MMTGMRPRAVFDLQARAGEHNGFGAKVSFAFSLSPTASAAGSFPDVSMCPGLLHPGVLQAPTLFPFSTYSSYRFVGPEFLGDDVQVGDPLEGLNILGVGCSIRPAWTGAQSGQHAH
jgi:hypothetical protein